LCFSAMVKNGYFTINLITLDFYMIIKYCFVTAET
jgi:hypothetical protein